MSNGKWKIGLLLFLLVLLPSLARAERLPIKTYTTADGLASNQINKIVRDSRGFLWFCTEDGLSRFDGYTFTNYGTEQGLPHTNITDFLETRGGEFWVATYAGLVRFNPRGVWQSRVVYANEPSAASSMFTVLVPEDEDRRARSFTVLREDHDGNIWCGTLKGLYRLNSSGAQFRLVPVDLPFPGGYAEQRFVNDLVEDRYGSLWVATPDGLYRRWPDGSSGRYTKSEGLPDYYLHGLLIDDQDRLWVASRYAGFFRLDTQATHTLPTVAFALLAGDFVQSEWTNQLFETSDHKLWAATARGLLEFIPGGDGQERQYRVYTMRSGLRASGINALAEDASGNLWLGSGAGAGAMKLARNGFVSYDEQDGITACFSIFADRAGGVCFRGYVLGDKRASIFEGGKLEFLNRNQATFWPRFGRFDGRRFNWFAPDVLKHKNFGWVDEGVTLQARSGEWWLAMGTNEGLYRFPPADNFTKIQKAQPLAVFGKDSVLRGRQIFRLFEDSQQRIWISTIEARGNGLALWDRESQSMRDLTDAPNLPSFKDDLARSFGEDRANDVWIGFNTGLARLRGDQFRFFTARDGLPAGAIQGIHTDHAGRLWLASALNGLIRVDDPASDQPGFAGYTAADDLSSNNVSVITEDLQGHIYAGTDRGLDELDPVTGHIRHFTTADGLTSVSFLSAFCDPRGVLWFGTHEGLSRFVPATGEQTEPPPVLITGLQAGGVRQLVSALGENEITLPEAAANQNQLQVEFVGLSFAPGEVLRYQYKLEGAGADWSTPSEQRVINFENLAPGRYRFLVRAVNSDGVQSTTPAVVSFRILPPVWQRWWFLTLAALGAALLVYALYRYRVARILEFVNMRTRIATDLHDDIGANLTKIAILTEVAKQQQGNGDMSESSPLSSVARISRESVTAMSDIVWAIDPKRDHLIDLVRRMRREAEDLFAATDIKLTFQAPGEEQDLRLDVNVRRDLFLIFKEAINNAARHSHCRQVAIAFQIESPWLTLKVADDGMGFDAATESDGHGLGNMEQRAGAIGGALKIRTEIGEGTTIEVKVPYAGSRRLRIR